MNSRLTNFSRVLYKDLFLNRVSEKFRGLTEEMFSGILTEAVYQPVPDSDSIGNRIKTVTKTK
jgi:hypothetical protein